MPPTFVYVQASQSCCKQVQSFRTSRAVTISMCLVWCLNLLCYLSQYHSLGWVYVTLEDNRLCQCGALLDLWHGMEKFGRAKLFVFHPL